MGEDRIANPGLYIKVIDSTLPRSHRSSGI